MSRSAPSPLVGRAAERERLAAAVAALTPRGSRAHPRGGTVVIVGEPGAGKSALLDDVLASVGGTTSAADGRVGSPTPAAVLRGGAVEIPGIDLATPYGVINEALRRARATGGDADARVVDAWFAPPDGASVDPASARASTLLDVVAALCQVKPRILVLEDVHWADPSSLAAAVLLARSAPDLPLLLVVTSRDAAPAEPLAQVLAQLTRAPGAQRIDLGPLDDPAAAALLARLGCPDADRAEVLRLAEGNPLALVELAAASSSGARPGEAGVPDGVRAVVAQAWGRAARDVRDVLATAALIGPTTTPVLLAAVLRATTSADPHEAVETALVTGLLSDRGDHLAWRHELHRAAVAALATPSRRPGIHAAIADALETGLDSGLTRTKPSRLAEIAAHRALAGEPAAAARAHLAAADAAFDAAAFPEALAQYADGLRDWDRLAADPPGLAGRRVAATLRAAECARWAGDPRLGLELLAATLPTVHGRDTADAEAALLQERLGWLRREVDDGEGAAHAYAQAVRLAERAGDAAVRATVLAGLAAWQLTRFQFEDAARSASSCLEVAEDPSSALASALATLGVVRAFGGAPEEGIGLLQRSFDVATRAGSEPDVWRYLGNLAFVYQNLGRTPDAVELALTARERARRTGVTRSPAVLPCLANGVSGLFALGRWDEAIALGEDVLGAQPPPGQAVAGLQLLLAELHAWRGDAEAAAPMLNAGRETAVAGRLTDLHAQACRVRARLAAVAGDVAAARTAVDEGLALLAEGNPISVVEACLEGLRVEALAQARADAEADAPRVRELARQVAALAQDDADHALEPGELELARAYAAHALGRAAPAPWTQAVAVLRTGGAPHQLAEALAGLGEAQLAARARAKAGEAWREALTLADELGLAPLAESVRAALRRARLSDAAASTAASSAVPPKAAALGLTVREVEVLEHLTHGRSNRQIARALGISERTVGVHVSNILDKLGVASRTQAAAAAHATQLLAVPD